ncbi:hypothetical protein BKA61DRAFT_605569 [Leptodontidium sp. MPI-SDFR-AT-0119]|nr:hypothetical protein BKA61DRAFT_605569 [Leptodontidium sp. MPI-SDFR-AT-0119]
MDSSSLFRCGVQACGSKGAQSIDKSGFTRNGKRKLLCISCCERLRVYEAARRHRRGVEAQKPSSTSSFTPAFDPLLNSIPEQLSTEPRPKRQRTAEYAAAPEAVKLAVGFLELEFELRKAASQTFPLQIASSYIRTSVAKYDDELSAASLRSVCCSCGRSVAAPDIIRLMTRPTLSYPRGVPSIIVVTTTTLGTSVQSGHKSLSELCTHKVFG